MDTYTHGHDASVIRHHASRTADNSAGFLIPRLRSGMRLLDIGCGPGSITIDLATRIAPGHTRGIDIAEPILETARKAAVEQQVTNVEFDVDDVYALAGPADEFDVVYAHQVLQHLTEPVAALREMRRVAKPGGVVAVRDADYGSMTWAPAHPLFDRWMELYQAVTARNGADANAGRHLLSWALDAGFEDVEVSTSTWSYTEPDGRSWWGEGWARRATDSAFATQAMSYGFATRAELDEISDVWRWWAGQNDGFFAMIHTEILAVA